MTFRLDDEDTMDGFDTEPEPSADSPGQEPSGYPTSASQQLDPVDSGYEQAHAEAFADDSEAEEDYEVSIGAVDKRMKIATYFRLILDGALFSDGSPEAKIVEKRIRAYVRGELEVLFGMKAAAAPTTGQFTPEEVDVLRQFIARLSKPAAVPTKVAAAPQLKPIQSPPAPQLVVKQAPAPVVAAKPVPKQAPAKPVAAPVAKKVDPRIPPQYRNDPTARIAGGRVYVQSRNGDGELLWTEDKGGKRQPLMKDVTLVNTPPPGAPQQQPQPSAEVNNMIMGQHAEAAVGSMERAAQRNPGMRSVASGLVNALTRTEE